MRSWTRVDNGRQPEVHPQLLWTACILEATMLNQAVGYDGAKLCLGMQMRFDGGYLGLDVAGVGHNSHCARTESGKQVESQG